MNRMTGDQRREEIIRILKTADAPVSGLALSKSLEVSRQVIVQDIALIRAKDIDIYATNRGYVLNEKNAREVFLVKSYIRLYNKTKVI